jgi:hypothetical protein
MDFTKGKVRRRKQGDLWALGRKLLSTDLNERHPFDIEICRIPPGKSHCPYHSHSAQWEFYHVVSGKGVVRQLMGPHQSKPATHSSSGQTDLTSSVITGHRILFCTS